MSAPTPSADRPVLPPGYGLPETSDGLLTWSEVEQRLVDARHYWLSTTRPDGTPHVVPRWGVWLDGRFWYDGAPSTRHVRNLASNPACALHLESATEVVVVEGTAERTSAAADTLGPRLAEAFGKYAAAGYTPSADSWAGDDGGGLCVLTPARALAWTTFPTDCTRFSFG